MNDKTLDQEVRIRVLEEVAKDIKETMHRMSDKMDNQFKWILGTLIALFAGSILAKLV